MKKIFIFAILVRLVCLYLFRNITNYDLQSYIQVGELTLKGINIYPEIAKLHHPYLPFFLYVEAFGAWLWQSNIIIIIFMKLINIIFDTGILYLIYLLSKKNIKTAFLYAINPVTILITTLHGQFDVIPVFFILLSIYWINIKKEALSIFSFSFAILTKTWPILFLIPILRKLLSHHSRGGGNPGSLDPRFHGDDIVKLVILITLFLIFPIAFITLYCLLFKATLINIAETLISYQGLWGIWGPWALLGKTRILWQKLGTSIFLICFFTYSYFNKEKNLLKNILNLLFFLFIFTTNFSIQYFVWITPFLYLIKPKKYLWLVVLISLYLFSFYCLWLFNLNLINIQNIIGFILWLSFIKVGYLSSK